MKLAIADPPYLGRADRYYGNGGGISRGRGVADRHPEAIEWDKPQRHRQLVRELSDNFDAWAIAMSPHSLGVYLSEVELGSRTGYRVGAWIKPNLGVPSGSRIHTAWEPVLFYLPPERRTRNSGPSVPDFVSANAPNVGFVGAKPRAWTRWVLDVLGATEADEIVDIFPGSGSVAAELAQGVLL